jgi:PmbA protein
MARFSMDDEFLGLPAPLPQKSADGADLQLTDPALERLGTEEKIRMAREMEEVALAHDPRVTMVEGAGFSDEQHEVMLVNSNGFAGMYRGSGCSLSCAVVAEEGGKKQVNYWYSQKRHLGDLETPADVGRKAAQRTVSMLGARTVPTGKYPVVLDPLIAASFLNSIAAGVNGETVYRKFSFLTEKLGQKIGPEFLTVYDDGTMPRGLATRPFDGEGLPTSHKTVIENGVLKSFLYDSYTARKAKTVSTGNAARGYSSTPHISSLNFYIPAGALSPQAIIRTVTEGFYITGMIGFGVDLVSGQFSRGASGMWIKDGEPAFPVHEVTVASNLLEMIAGIEIAGNDLEFRSSVASPTLKLREMTVSGR